MFTGLIEGIGKVRAVSLVGREMTLSIVPGFDVSDSRIGDSVCVNGACLTITDMGNGFFSAYASEETVSRTTLDRLRQGHEVNLERALRFSDRLGGHLVSGHVDGIGIILRKEKVRESWLLRVGIDESSERYLVEKGSIAVDGISLTINRCRDNYFEVNIIPETATGTTLLKKRVKDPVNIETDLIAKYIEKFMIKERKSVKAKSSAAIDREMLENYGFNGSIK
jgi:riboflavin synthase